MIACILVHNGIAWVQFARTVAGPVVAVAGGQAIGMPHAEATRHGFGEIGMLADRGWRDRGAGSALVRADPSAP